MARAEGVTSGAGIAIFGSLAYVPSNRNGPATVVDLRDPTAPRALSEVDGAGGQGAGIIAYPDGRLVAAVSTGRGIDLVDTTDPSAPEVVSQLSPPSGGHKAGVVPGTPFLYNAGSDGGLPIVQPTGNFAPLAKGTTEIYDASDPADPKLVRAFENGHSCHHIFFWIGNEKQRAICAGVEVTQLWDIADPAAPKVIVDVPVHHGDPRLPAASAVPVASSHTAMLNAAGDVLIVGDEFLVGSPAECTGPSPLGALWFYDVSVETSPKLLGWWSAPPRMLEDPSVTGCTAHHGRLVPDPEGKRDLLVMAWFGAGVFLLDISDPPRIRVVDHWNEGANAWEAWYDQGYVITGDLARGMDVFVLT